MNAQSTKASAMRDRYDFSDSKPNPHAKRMKQQVSPSPAAEPKLTGPSGSSGIDIAAHAIRKAPEVASTILPAPHTANRLERTPRP